MIHWASLSMEFLLVWHHCHPCDIDVLQYRADFRIRLHEKKGLCTRLGNGSQSLPISGSWSCYLVLCSPIEFHVPGTYLPPRARCYHLAHHSQFTFGACPSLPF